MKNGGGINSRAIFYRQDSEGSEGWIKPSAQSTNPMGHWFVPTQTNRSPAQFRHGAVDPGEGQGEHVVFKQLTEHLRGMGILPNLFFHWI